MKEERSKESRQDSRPRSLTVVQTFLRIVRSSIRIIITRVRKTKKARCRAYVRRIVSVPLYSACPSYYTSIAPPQHSPVAHAPTKNEWSNTAVREPLPRPTIPSFRWAGVATWLSGTQQLKAGYVVNPFLAAVAFFLYTVLLS